MAGRSLNGARALITGASSGIGRELAVALARRRTRLILLARRTELLEDICRQCAQLGGQARAVAGDVTETAIRGKALNAAHESFGGLDLLINNAGVSAHGAFADSEESVLRKVMEVNFFAAVELTRRSPDALCIALHPGTVATALSAPFATSGLEVHSPAAAARHLLAVVDQLTADANGGFFDWRGQPVPW